MSKRLDLLPLLVAVLLNGCGVNQPPPTGSVQTPPLKLTDDKLSAPASQSTEPALALEQIAGSLSGSPAVSSVIGSHERLRANVRVLDSATTAKIASQDASQITFNGAIVMSPGNIFVIRGLAYKASEVKRAKGQVIVSVEPPTESEVFDPFDRQPFAPAVKPH